MYDFHSHVLPFMDDGSKSTEESLEMLRMSARGGVSHLAATPHFFPDRMSPGEFIDKRCDSWAALSPLLQPDMPHIRLGAEVCYYEGICLLDGILPLCLEGTRLLLLEMPFTEWSNRTLAELDRLSGSRGITILLAHIERYISLQPAATWRTLRQSGILFQANAEFFIERKTRRRALRLLISGELDLLGSDCHNTDSRAPDLREAAEIILGKSGGKAALDDLSSRAAQLFN